MMDKARHGSETVVVETVLEENNGRREAGTLSGLKTIFALPKQSMPM